MPPTPAAPGVALLLVNGDRRAHAAADAASFQNAAACRGASRFAFGRSGHDAGAAAGSMAATTAACMGPARLSARYGPAHRALGSLIHTDAAKVIPMLKEIALESGNLAAARRALFVLAQSGRPEGVRPSSKSRKPARSSFAWLLCAGWAILAGPR